MVKLNIDALRELSVPDRVRLAQALWDSIQPTTEQLPVTEEQKRVLDQRLRDHEADPSSAISWDELRSQLGIS